MSWLSHRWRTQRNAIRSVIRRIRESSSFWTQIALAGLPVSMSSWASQFFYFISFYFHIRCFANVWGGWSFWNEEEEEWARVSLCVSAQGEGFEYADVVFIHVVTDTNDLVSITHLFFFFLFLFFFSYFVWKTKGVARLKKKWGAFQIWNLLVGIIYFNPYYGFALEDASANSFSFRSRKMLTKKKKGHYWIHPPHKRPNTKKKGQHTPNTDLKWDKTTRWI